VKQICVVYNPRIPQAAPLAEEVARWLEAKKLKVSLGSTEEPSPKPPVKDCDLLLVLGGDGSILRTAHAAAAHQAPILGVNLGRVGFLAEARPENWQDVVSSVLDGRHWVEERMMLRVTVRRGSKVVAQEDALNDAVVGRGTQARIIRLRVEIDGQPMTEYAVDGIVGATATGSTAYALAAGGPILSPEARSIVLVPVAPHLCAPWPLVLAEGSRILIAPTDGREAALTVDGDRTFELSPSDSVLVETSPLTTRFARVQEKEYFHRTLMARLVARRPD
jgi:NAD+ kinase